MSNDLGFRFRLGERVEVENLDLTGHVRVPMFVRQKIGEVTKLWGVFDNPEKRAYGQIGKNPTHLYEIKFRLVDLWRDYDGSAADTVKLDIYQHWLRPLGGLHDRPQQ